jgi:Mrp family chromosome partitioning ATPase
VCVGLAVALATSTTKSVLLLDANLRRPALHQLLGAPLRPGLRELLAERGQPHRPYDPARVPAEPEVSALSTTVPNLWLLPSGDVMEHPAQLMTSEATKIQIEALRARYHYVVIDCPPLLAAVDAASICRFASGVIVVVRAGVTPREDVRRAQELLEGVPILGAVLTGV